MKNIDIELTRGVEFSEAEKAAWKVAEKAFGGFALMGWYDKAREMGAPQEACSLEKWTCVRDYAEHHNAGLRVTVNRDEYEFFFSEIPEGTEEIDREGVVATHAGIAKDEFNNVQGG